MLARKQKTYSILKADDDSDDDYVDKSSVTTASSRRSDNHKKCFRKHGHTLWESMRYKDGIYCM